MIKFYYTDNDFQHVEHFRIKPAEYIVVFQITSIFCSVAGCIFFGPGFSDSDVKIELQT